MVLQTHLLKRRATQNNYQKSYSTKGKSENEKQTKEEDGKRKGKKAAPPNPRG